MKKACCIFLLAILSESAYCVTLDQSFEPSPVTFVAGPPAYQTFTNSLNGQLVQVDLLLNVIDGSDRDLIVRIWNKDLSTVLGEKTIAPSALPPNNPSTNNVWVPIDLSFADISVVAGVTNAIQVDQGPGFGFLSVNWHGAEIGTYEGGSVLRDLTIPGILVPTAEDFGFRTHVAISDPSGVPDTGSTIILMGLGLCAIGMARCRSSREGATQGKLRPISVGNRSDDVGCSVVVTAR